MSFSTFSLFKELPLEKSIEIIDKLPLVVIMRLWLSGSEAHGLINSDKKLLQRLGVDNFEEQRLKDASQRYDLNFVRMFLSDQERTELLLSATQGIEKFEQKITELAEQVHAPDRRAAPPPSMT